jgi:hypothetical protein
MHCYSEQSVQKLAILVPEMHMTASYDAHTQAMNARYVPLRAPGSITLCAGHWQYSASAYGRD